MNELFNGLEYVRVYIDDLSIISNGNFEDHINRAEKYSLRSANKSIY